MQVELSDKCFLCRRLEAEGLSHLAPASIALQPKSLGKVASTHVRRAVQTSYLSSVHSACLWPTVHMHDCGLQSTYMTVAYNPHTSKVLSIGQAKSCDVAGG